MASNVVKVTLLADSKPFTKGFKEAETATGKFQKKSEAFAGVVKGFFAIQAAQAVKQFVGDSIQAFSDLEQATGAVETVYGEFADQIIEASEDAAQALGLSAADYQQLAANLGGQLQTLGFTVGESATKSQELIEVGADLAATYGGTVADAVAAVGSLMRGERDPIEKYAVSVKDADIQARVLAEGLDTSTTEAEKNSEAIAALDILLGQAEKSEGQFAREADTAAGKQARLTAEIEDQKAALGEGLLPITNAFYDLMSDLLPVVNLVADALAAATGNLNLATEAAEAYEEAHGRAPETAKEVVDSILTEVDARRNLIDTLLFGRVYQEEVTKAILASAEAGDRSAESIDALKAEVDGLGESGDFTQEEVDHLNGKLDGLVEQSGLAKTGLSKFTGSMEYAADATEDTTDAIDDNVTALQKHATELRKQTDPIFALTEAQRNLREKTDAVTEAEKEFGKKSPEYLTALEDQAGASLDFRDAQANVASQSGITRETYRRNLIAMGLYTEEQIDLMVADFDRANGYKFNEKIINLRVEGGDIIADTIIGKKAKGGPVDKNKPYVVGEEGKEIFVPNTAGTIIPNNKIGKSGAGVVGGGGPVIINNITIHAGLGSDPNAISKAIVESLQRYARNNGGSIPIRTRP